MHGAHQGAHKDQELGIGMGRVAGIKEGSQLGIAHRVVQVLAGSVDAVEGLFMEQALEAVALGHVAQGCHDHMVVIDGNVGLLEEGRNFVLSGSDLVVAGADRHAQLVEVALGLHHEGQDALGDDAKILVAEFLSLGRPCPKERAACHKQVLAGKGVVVVNEEVFLLKAGIGYDWQLGVHVKEVKNAPGLVVQSLA